MMLFKERKRAEKARKRKSAQRDRQRLLQEAEEQERLHRQEQERSKYTPQTPDAHSHPGQSGQGSRQGRRRSSVRALDPPVLPTKKPPTKASTPELNENTAFYFEVAGTAEASEGSNLQLVDCPTCGRKFASDRLSKHSKVCKSNSKKGPRKVFDPVKMRTQGTEQAKYIDPRSLAAKPQPQPKVG